MPKRKSSEDFFNLIGQVRNKFVELSDQWPKRTGNPLLLPATQAKNIKVVWKLYQRFGRGVLVHDDKDLPHVKDFMEWLVAKAAELSGRPARPFAWNDDWLVDKSEGPPNKNPQLLT